MPQVPPTPPNPGDVIVTGQRRPAGSPGPFPERPVPIVPQGEFDEKEPLGEFPDPCTNPETALPWNADAAAAGSVDKFLQKAATLGGPDAPNGSPVLTHREFARALERNTDGSVSGNAVSHGNPLAPGDTSYTMDVDYTGVSPNTYIGFAHTHPNGDAIPSEHDWTEFLRVNKLAREAGRTSETFYLYVTAVGQDGAPHRTYVYQDGPRAAGSPPPPKPSSLGDEVNPDAEPCP